MSAIVVEIQGVEKNKQVSWRGNALPRVTFPRLTRVSIFLARHAPFSCTVNHIKNTYNIITIILYIAAFQTTLFLFPKEDTPISYSNAPLRADLQ